ncbi:uncharacterized protein LOC125954424 [Anopheles darlingi]|uniref:uncharacterized protein LOC125954424 n=1 Tax=Anopheles darlingi TaxID=43151 RepID=UPI0020FFFB16|nr:uncharacterized protein LOC125954424 [Anopheles darlingi]XP_049540725.1 uncharacterized protein LOC125954424 [Anopheles darlingi]XP_049540726.1 uncharacterized protein LOC125954424 [Anopheles darlingi]XP_049540727.1 uncharacterized protein LOC125954424 [Anopheles darlingi]XP_049540728.1 uncharacterized protein LOC125954424 [Anopheles darlingi]
MSISNGKTSSDIENVDWNSSGMLTHTRYGSTSSQVSQSSGDICRICHCESDTLNPLLTPCYCSGSLKFVHQTCLQQWLTASETNACELCKFPFIMHTKIKPFNEWRSLDMSGVERRRLCCAVLFHCAAGLCVIWSLCVLIERAAEEVRRSQIGWPFWTKLIVVTVGLTGGVVFMYIQCKQYLSLCNRWRARNRILLIQNAPEKIHPPQSPPMPQFRRVRTAATSGGQSASMAGSQYQPQPSSIVGGSIGGTGAAGMSGGTGGSSGQLIIRTFDQAPLGTVSIGSGRDQCELQINHQGQIIAANIESTSSIGYDRDWTLDDISQVSFKPCPQGSGSLTPMPFHDSVHNICEAATANTMTTTGSGGIGTIVGGSSSTTTTGGSSQHRYSTVSNTSTAAGAPADSTQPPVPVATNAGEQHTNGGSTTKANELSLFKLNGGADRSRSSSPGVTAAVATSTVGPSRYVNSAIFLENRDILNDPSSVTVEHTHAPYPNKLYHRHSTVLAGGPSLASFSRSPEAAGAAAANAAVVATATTDEAIQREPNKPFRRYSDTKLLQKQSLSFPQEPLALCEIGTHTKDQLLLNPKSIIYDMSGLLGAPVVLDGSAAPDTVTDSSDGVGSGTGSHRHHHGHHPQHHHHHHHLHHHHRHHHPTYSTPTTTDIQFDSAAGQDGQCVAPPMSDDDALEMNIQDILEYDQQHQQQLHYCLPEQRNRRTEQRLSLENILQSASYHDDPSAVPFCRPYYDHQQQQQPQQQQQQQQQQSHRQNANPMMISSLSLSGKVPSHRTMQLALTPPFTSGYQQPPPLPRSSMAGTVPSSSEQPASLQQPPYLQHPRSHGADAIAGVNRRLDEEGSNKLKLFKSLPNLSASSENLLP